MGGEIISKSIDCSAEYVFTPFLCNTFIMGSKENTIEAIEFFLTFIKPTEAMRARSGKRAFLKPIKKVELTNILKRISF